MIIGTVKALRLAIGLAALALIGWVVYQFWVTPQPATKPTSAPAPVAKPLAPPAPPQTAPVDRWTVIDASLTAEPAWVRDDEPPWQRRGPQTPLPPSAARGTVRWKPALRVTLDWQASLDDTIPSLWPRARTVHLLRASDPAATFQPIHTVPPAEVLAEVQSCSGAAIFNGVRQPRRDYGCWWTDAAVEPGKRYYYKLRVLGEADKVILESGYCSAIALALPQTNLQLDSQDFPGLTWDAAVMDNSQFLVPPALVFGLHQLHPLARFPVGVGATKLPLKVPPPQSLPLECSVEAVVTVDSWSQLAGPSRVTRREILTRTVLWPRPPAPVKPAAARAETVGAVTRGIFVTTDPAEVRRGTGTWQLRFQLPSDARLTLAAVTSDSAGRRALELSTRGWSEAPGLSERQSFEFLFPVYRSKLVNTTEHSLTSTMEQTDSPITARVSAVRAPLPTGLRVSAGPGQTRVTWERFPFDPQDWADGPAVVVRRADEHQVRTVGDQLEVRGEVEVFRGPANATEFIDRDVREGAVYFYTFTIEGVTRATSWSAVAGEYECLVPVHVRSDAVSSAGRVAARASGPRTTIAGAE